MPSGPWRLDETIAAIATASTGALRGIVRLSGPEVSPCLQQIFAPPPPQHGPAACHWGQVRLTHTDALAPAMLPCALYYWPGERSYTRQPLAEFHTVGSPPLLEWLLETLCQYGARLAEPGEFTLRAFLSGRIDLTQAEAVLGVIDADNATQLHAALRQLAGGLAQPLAALRDRLLDLLAQVEAGLDFVEEDIHFITTSELERELHGAQQLLDQIAGQLTTRGSGQGLPIVALHGLPNVGKSCLFNALAGKSLAMVSPQAGTTRDWLAVDVVLDGLPLHLVDTAGDEGTTPVSPDVSDPTDPISAAAQRLGSEIRSQAALRLLCCDASRPLEAWEQAQLAAAGADTLVVRTKVDLIPPHQSFMAEPHAAGDDRESTSPSAGAIPGIGTSAATGQGLDELRSAIALRLAGQAAEASVAATAVRCQESLRAAAHALAAAQNLAEAQAGDELVACELRLTLEALGAIAGAVYTDDLLDRVFSRFCIGK